MGCFSRRIHPIVLRLSSGDAYRQKMSSVVVRQSRKKSSRKELRSSPVLFSYAVAHHPLIISPGDEMLSSCTLLTRTCLPITPLLHTCRTYATSSPDNISFLMKSFLLPTIRINNTHTQQPTSLFQSLQKRISTSPSFYHNAPVVLDFEDVDNDTNDATVDLLVRGVKKLELVPVGVTYTQNVAVQVSNTYPLRTKAMFKNIANKHNMALLNSTRTKPPTGRAAEDGVLDFPASSHIKHTKPDKVIVRSMSSSTAPSKYILPLNCLNVLVKVHQQIEMPHH